MTLEVLQKEMIAAMKAKDAIRKSVLSEIKTAALNLAIEEKHKENITEDNVLAAMKKCKKVYQAQIDTCPADRVEWLEHFKECMKCIESYLPQQMSEDEVRKEVYNILASVDVQQAGKGAIMKAVMPRLKGKADGKLINKVVTEICEKSGE